MAIIDPFSGNCSGHYGHLHGFSETLFNRAFRLRKAPQIVAVNEIGKVVLVHFGTLEKDGLKDLASRLIHTTDVGTH
jgi:hypothetical protein